MQKTNFIKNNIYFWSLKGLYSLIYLIFIIAGITLFIPVFILGMVLMFLYGICMLVAECFSDVESYIFALNEKIESLDNEKNLGYKRHTL